MKTTEIGNSYWNNTGAYQTEYHELYDKHVPVSGACETLNGELIRAMSRLFYEYYNNGNGNAREDIYDTVTERCWSCGGSGYVGEESDEEECEDCCGCGEVEEEEIVDTEINQMYEDFLKLIEENVDTIKADCDKIRNFIKGDFHLDQKEIDQMYNSVNDQVMFYVINHEDKDLPDWYKVNQQ
jgi:RecJ-like exonuclease